MRLDRNRDKCEIKKSAFLPLPHLFCIVVEVVGVGLSQQGWAGGKQQLEYYMLLYIKASLTFDP